MNEKSGLRKREKELYREAALHLVEYLNHPERLNATAKGELKKIETMLRALTELKRREASGDPIIGDEPEITTVNEVLANYRWITALHVGGGRYLYFAPDSGHRDVEERMREVNNGTWHARFFSQTIVDLANASLLERIHPCAHCGTWVFGAGIYCSKKCKQAAYRSKPGFKVQAAEYQKKYYKDVLSPVTGWAARQKRSRRRKTK